MKLREYLDGETSEYVYIGAKSSYFWIGKRTDAERFLPKVGTYYMRRMTRNIGRARSEIKRHSSLLKDETDPTKKKKLKHTVKRIQDRVKFLQNYQKNYVPLLDREVLEVHDRTWVEPLGRIYVLDSIENGLYWNLDECRQKWSV